MGLSLAAGAAGVEKYSLPAWTECLARLELSLPFQADYLIQSRISVKHHHSRLEWTWEWWWLKGFTVFKNFRTSELQPHQRLQFSVIPRTNIKIISNLKWGFEEKSPNVERLCLAYMRLGNTDSIIFCCTSLSYVDKTNNFFPQLLNTRH